MAAPPQQSRRSSSSSSSRHHSWQPDDLQSLEADYDFCNAYWSTPVHGRARGEERSDWGRGGYELLLGRMRMGTKTLEELKGFYKDRATMEDDYAKKLTKLSRHPFGLGETGHLDRAILQTKGEVDSMSKAHVDLANLMRTQESQVNDFLVKREGARKTQQTAIEKKWKELTNTRQHVLKAKDKYEQDAISINALHAQVSLLQGRDLDKATMKLDKAQQTVLVNERDYKHYTSVLKEMTGSWNMAWKAFCDLCQDQEEERLEFVKGRLWDWANALSTVAMAEDESAERTRTALEQCEAKTDLKIFVQATGTGNSIPDPLPFTDFSKGSAPPKQSYKVARFNRSSTRMPGVKHSPSAVDDIAKAFHQQPQRQSSGPPPQQQHQQQQRGVTPTTSTQSLATTAARPQSRDANPNRPPSRGEHLTTPNSCSNVHLASSESTDFPTAGAASQETTPTRPKLAESTSTSASTSGGRFAVSPSANLRGSSERVPSTTSSSTVGGGAPLGGGGGSGKISAGAFQRPANSPSMSLAGTAASPPSTSSTSFLTDSPSFSLGGASSPKPYSAPIPSQPQQQPGSSASTLPAGQSGSSTNDGSKEEKEEAEEEDDPLAQALKTLQATSPRPSPSPGAVGLPGMVSPPGGGRPTHKASQSQASLGGGVGGGGGGGGRSRPTSPAPMAAMMQPPPPQTAGGRPSSRQSQSQSQTASHPNRYSSTSQGGGGGGGGSQVGIGARGRSPSPQPFTHPHPHPHPHPEALRPHSPSPGMNPARSTSPGPGGGMGSGFASAPALTMGGGGSEGGYGSGGGGHQKQPSLGAPPGAYGAGGGGGGGEGRQQFGRAPSPGPGQYARAPSPGPLGYGRAPSPAPQHQQQQQPQQGYRGPTGVPLQQQQQQHQAYRAPSPAPQQQAYRSPSPAPQHAQQHQQHPSAAYSQALPQQFQSPPPTQQQQQPLHQRPAQHFQHPTAAAAGYGTSPSLVGLQSPSYHQHPSPSLIGINSPVSPSSAASPYAPQQQIPQPQQTFRHPPGGYNQAAIPTQHQLGVSRTPSLHSGASSAGNSTTRYSQTFGTNGAPPQQQPQQYQQPAPVQYQQQPPPQAQVQPSPSVGAGPGGPPTGQYTDDGKPIIFYVNAIYDYQAASEEEFSFSQGDVIAVTDTDPDGWWKGNKVGVGSGIKLFPSNFTELLP